jgi:hypothetical protein
MVSRKAVMICCPDKDGSPLPGTALDIRNFKNYLLSPRGGAWLECEIVVLTDPDLNTAYRTVCQTTVDYLLVYFSGHGATANNERLIKFKDGLAVDQWFMTGNSPRQLMLVDACRIRLAAIGAIPGAEEEFSSFIGESEARTLFDQYILQSPPGKMIVHATRKGEVALETTSLGGIFTYYLLESATYMCTVTDYLAVGILQVVGKVRQNLREDGYKQTPVLAWQEGQLRVPFMISVPQMIIGGVVERPPMEPLTESQRLVLGVVIAAGIYQLLKNAS